MCYCFSGGIEGARGNDSAQARAVCFVLVIEGCGKDVRRQASPGSCQRGGLPALVVSGPKETSYNLAGIVMVWTSNDAGPVTSIIVCSFYCGACRGAVVRFGG